MPTYEYRCPRCGRFEAFQSIKEEPLAACPTCASPVKRLISANVNIIFKGSGFYVTDNRKGTSPGSNGKNSSGDDAGSGSEPKSAGAADD